MDLYEALTNLLVINVEHPIDPKTGLEMTMYHCVFTEQDKSMCLFHFVSTAFSFNLSPPLRPPIAIAIAGINFTLQFYKAPSDDDPEKLITKVRYEPKDMQMLPDEFWDSVGFLAKQNEIVFPDDQCDMFYKSMYNFMTTRDPFDGIGRPGMPDEDEEMEEDGEEVGEQEVFEIE